MLRFKYVKPEITKLEFNYERRQYKIPKKILSDNDILPFTDKTVGQFRWFGDRIGTVYNVIVILNVYDPYREELSNAIKIKSSFNKFKDSNILSKEDVVLDEDLIDKINKKYNVDRNVSTRVIKEFLNEEDDEEDSEYFSEVFIGDPAIRYGKNGLPETKIIVPGLTNNSLFKCKYLKPNVMVITIKRLCRTSLYIIKSFYR